MLDTLEYELVHNIIIYLDLLKYALKHGWLEMAKYYTRVLSYELVVE